MRALPDLARRPLASAAVMIVMSHGFQLWVIPDREAVERHGVHRTQAMCVQTDGVLVCLTKPFAPARA